MIEIIPNWHPIFVHFTVALPSVSVLFFLAARFIPSERWRGQWSAAAYWALWAGAAITLITFAAGWYAFETVRHDDPSHAAMLEHRALAIPTVIALLALAAWAWRNHRKAPQRIPALFLAALLAFTGLLAATAWHGAELVYRHGLGVMSLPETEGEGHAHEHAGPEAHHDENRIHEPHDEGS